MRSQQKHLKVIECTQILTDKFEIKIKKMTIRFQINKKKEKKRKAELTEKICVLETFGTNKDNLKLSLRHDVLESRNREKERKKTVSKKFRSQRPIYIKENDFAFYLFGFSF